MNSRRVPATTPCPCRLRLARRVTGAGTVSCVTPVALTARLQGMSVESSALCRWPLPGGGRGQQRRACDGTMGLVAEEPALGFATAGPGARRYPAARLAEQSRLRPQAGGPAGAGDPAVRADAHRPRAGAGRRPPRRRAARGTTMNEFRLRPSPTDQLTHMGAGELPLRFRQPGPMAPSRRTAGRQSAGRGLDAALCSRSALPACTDITKTQDAATEWPKPTAAGQHGGTRTPRTGTSGRSRHD